MKQTTKMRKSKLEYFINAVTYSIERMLDATVDELIYKSVALRIKFIRVFLPKNLKERFDAHLKRNENVMAMVRRQNGYWGAKKILELLFIFLECAILISSTILFDRFKISHPEIGIPIEVPIISMVLIFFILSFPVSNAIDKDIYEAYARIFDKKDKEWHTKWRLITIVICVCIVGGLFIAFKI